MILPGGALSVEEKPGEFVVRKDSASGELHCIKADPTIYMSFAFLAEADAKCVQCANDIVTFTLANGVWIYRIIERDSARLLYRLRRVD